LDPAWKLFGHATQGWGRVQAICDFVHGHIVFGYEHARVTRTACEAYQEKRGVLGGLILRLVLQSSQQ